MNPPLKNRVVNPRPRLVEFLQDDIRRGLLRRVLPELKRRAQGRPAPLEGD